MGLVDYSESESESESPQQTPVAKAPPAVTAAAPPSKKPFQKVVDRSRPGKIVVNLPQETASKSDEPPTKRARTGASEGGRFSGFNSFLPPPKNAGKKPAAAGPSAGKPRPGINLQTSAAPGFNRDAGDDVGEPQGGSAPPPKQAEPSVPEEQKPADQVKLVGKPMMFKPLSVSRNKKKAPKTTAPSSALAATAPSPSSSVTASITEPSASAVAAAPPPPKKIPLFSMHTEEPSETPSSSMYEPLFVTQQQQQEASHQQPLEGFDYTQQQYGGGSAESGPAPTPGGESLDSIANDLNLSAAERRQLFGRSGGDVQAAKRVINFNMDTEYRHNEEIRATGEQQIHNPVRAIQGSGKHNLRQLVQNVQNQREALEDSFAKGKSNRKEASSKYGW
ncbi:Pfam:PRCC Cterm [Geosmithia morbida]|uniref:Pfam:PRCC Cterm n=1 Tax=Geosmithia morbida TaxID=1094350 RepID=A0A9P5D677_9HYPO|nr:Pfam:PRCC Cterm [Geosmithia morbida]KAF4123229.1 Pfam:PRCC Cterm [Geosmithia morbida]